MTSSPVDHNSRRNSVSVTHRVGAPKLRGQLCAAAHDHPCASHQCCRHQEKRRFGCAGGGNDYLAKRDKEWMGKVYEFLGLTVGCIIYGLDTKERQENYNCDITYGTNNQFGFDYLRDNMILYKEEKVQRELYYAIVDEVDSILIDEARTPLIISGQGEESTDMYVRADRFAQMLTGRILDPEEDKKQDIFDRTMKVETVDYIVDEKKRTATLTEH